MAARDRVGADLRRRGVITCQVSASSTALCPCASDRCPAANDSTRTRSLFFSHVAVNMFRHYLRHF